MVAVLEKHRGKGIATQLVKQAINVMIAKDADEVWAMQSMALLIITHRP